MSTAPFLFGWAVGGAHLKRATIDATGRLVAVDMAACALWQGLNRLDEALAALPAMGTASLRTGRSFVTMTGELTDLWPDRARGVAGLSEALADRLGPDIAFYAGPDGFVPLSAAPSHADKIASANWHATAAALALTAPEGLMMDIGSTTTDIIRFSGGAVASRGYSDAERLAAGELVYTGIARTPVMALAPHLPFRGVMVPLMMEYFATTADIYRLTGELPEHADLHPAADGGPKTEEGSARRLLRMVGRDLGPSTLAEAQALAAAAAEEQLHRLSRALALVLSAAPMAVDAPVVGAGVGRFLVARLADRLDRPFADAGVLLADGTAHAVAAADCAPAVAVARIGASRIA